MVHSTPLIPALRRQRQADLYQFEASLVRTEKPCFEKTNKNNNRPQEKRGK